jgi:hypothetical protein
MSAAITASRRRNSSGAEFLVGHANQRFQCDLIAEHVGAADVHDLAPMKLDEAEDVGVCATLHLAEQPLVGLTQKASSLTSESPDGRKVLV